VNRPGCAEFNRVSGREGLLRGVRADNAIRSVRRVLSVLAAHRVEEQVASLGASQRIGLYGSSANAAVFILVFEVDAKRGWRRRIE